MAAGDNDKGAGGAETGLREDSLFDTLLRDVPLELSVELGRASLTLREVAQRLSPGSIIPLGKLTGEKLDVRVNERLVARGEAVAVGERYGVRIVDLVVTKEKNS